jgi:hypothetical protein
MSAHRSLSGVKQTYAGRPGIGAIDPSLPSRLRIVAAQTVCSRWFSLGSNLSMTLPRVNTD